MSLLIEVINTAGVEYKQRGEEVNVNCPFCIERGETEDTRFRLGINTISGSAHCFNCSFSEHSIYYLAKKLCRIWNLTFNLRSAIRKEPTEELTPKLASKPEETGWPDGYEPFTNKPDKIEAKARAYLKSRGISLLQIVQHKIGFAAAGKYAGRILFPVLYKDKCYGVVGRGFEKDITPKYLNSEGIKMLWGTDVRARSSIVVEGVVDALHVEKAMMSRPSTTAVATLGCSMTDVQFQQLKGYEKVILLPDQDSPGIRGVIALAKRCTSRSIPVLVVVPDEMDGRDAGDMSSDEITSLISDAKPWSISVEHKLKSLIAREGMK